MLDQYYNDFDISKTVRVSDPEAVKSEILSLLTENQFSSNEALAIEKSFDLFSQLYLGQLPNYHACDALYHDIQHSLDMTLTTTRLLLGYQKTHGGLSSDEISLGIVTALFHDAGYIREKNDQSGLINGAEYTSIHVSRSEAFILQHLPDVGLAEIANRAAQIVHLTGYEIQPQFIQPDIASDRLIGDMVATADLITQMADRCYLEKCRDRLFPELTLAAHAKLTSSSHIPVHDSAEELLYNTPRFYRIQARKRLEYHFKSVFHYAEAFFNGPNLYIEGIESNIRYLEELINEAKLGLLRRELPKNLGEKVFPYALFHSLLSAKLQLEQASQ